MGERNKSLSVILKPGYAPPEQYSRKGEQGAWTDVYALGATMYRILTGQSPPETMDRMINDEMQQPVQLEASIPQAVNNALVKALTLDRKQRYQTMQEFRQAIGTQSVAGQVHTVAVSNVAIQAGTSGEYDPIAAQAAKATTTGNKNSKLLLAIVGGAVVALMVILLIVILVVVPSYKYKNAVELWNNGDVQQAQVLFGELGEYKQSTDYLHQAEAIQAYKSAQSFFGTAEYEQALSYLESATVLMPDNNKYAIALNETKSYKALEEDFTRFYSNIDNLGIDEIRSNTVAMGEDMSALSALPRPPYTAELSSILEMITPAVNGVELMTNGQPFDAFPILQEVAAQSDLSVVDNWYNQCKEQCAQVLYQQALAQYDAGHYQQAITLCEQANSYQSFQQNLDLIRNCNFMILNQYYLSDLVNQNYYNSEYFSKVVMSNSVGEYAYNSPAYEFDADPEYITLFMDFNANLSSKGYTFRLEKADAVNSFSTIYENKERVFPDHNGTYWNYWDDGDYDWGWDSGIFRFTIVVNDTGEEITHQYIMVG